MEPTPPPPRAWTPARIILTILGIVLMLSGVALFAYGALLFFTVILLPVGIAFMAFALLPFGVGLLMVAGPWVHSWWQRRKAGRASP